ncbi:lactate utilization protein [Clostridium taeniosporum]|uniref:Lactate utilization protein n=1 Tax=Clostridium taeniosporum TaxID=394958 RepID=A0A1D7XNH7_9CLOT|nr:lactate utilization protein [Clostridium taeniosporum]AOR24837.1 lactate utilization protein [Clostridium taeniosporum]
MDNNVVWVNEQKILRTIDELIKNNMNGYFAKSREEIINIIEDIIEPGNRVAFGGSMTLFESGVMDYLKSGKYDLLDRNKPNLTREEVNEIYRQAFLSDAYFTSSNAITEKGEIYNVDGNGNRVAAILYGPKKVIIIAGSNKIVPTIDDAIKRNKEKSAPANAKRLNRATPCSKIGKCMDCSSKERICNEYTLIKRQVDPNRIHVIFMNEILGY